MRIAVVGLWHLGTVTAACLADGRHEVTGIDDPDVISRLVEGHLPVQEPGLAELIEAQTKAGRLRFVADRTAVADQDIVWITLDTPVDQNDVADEEYVFERAAALIPYMTHGSMLLISSQMPVGSTARLERHCRTVSSGKRIGFAYSPENLRLGKAIEIFKHPDRVVVGIRSPEDRERLEPVWAPFRTKIEWMSVESAEMTKHALNAFLATSVTFINEIARICERVGADAQEVEHGLKSDIRIGPRAYLHPGAAFSGGTLARDIVFLRKTASRIGIEAPLFDGVKQSNEIHRNWLQHRFQECVGDPAGKVIAVLGLTYKPGTNTLRRSSALETCAWLYNAGATVNAYDPAFTTPPAELPAAVHLQESAEAALAGADALLVATEWPDFRRLSADVVAGMMNQAIVIDPYGHLEATLGTDERIRYFAVGRSR